MKCISQGVGGHTTFVVSGSYIANGNGNDNTYIHANNLYYHSEVEAHREHLESHQWCYSLGVSDASSTESQHRLVPFELGA